MMSETAPRLQRSSTVMGSEVDGGVIVMDIESGSYFSFNDTGSAIWRALAAPVTQEEIVARLCEDYEIDLATCRAKVADFVAYLSAARIVVPVEAG